jgi:hypothetical protein
MRACADRPSERKGRRAFQSMGKRHNVTMRRLLSPLEHSNSPTQRAAKCASQCTAHESVGPTTCAMKA